MSARARARGVRGSAHGMSCARLAGGGTRDHTAVGGTGSMEPPTRARVPRRGPEPAGASPRTHVPTGRRGGGGSNGRFRRSCTGRIGDLSIDIRVQ